mgnify:FL=1
MHNGITPANFFALILICMYLLLCRTTKIELASEIKAKRSPGYVQKPILPRNKILADKCSFGEFCDKSLIGAILLMSAMLSHFSRFDVSCSHGWYTVSTTASLKVFEQSKIKI